MPPQLLDQLRAADDDAGLRAAKQLVAGETGKVGAGPQAVARRRLVLEREEGAGAEVVHERELVPARDCGELLHRGLLGEAEDAEVGLVDAQQERGLGADRAVVVGRTRAVRRPDLVQDRAGAANTSGMRKPSPISISSPRETSTSRPPRAPRARA